MKIELVWISALVDQIVRVLLPALIQGFRLEQFFDWVEFFLVGLDGLSPRHREIPKTIGSVNGPIVLRSFLERPQVLVPLRAVGPQAIETARAASSIEMR